MKKYWLIILLLPLASALVFAQTAGLADDRNMATNDGTANSADFYFDLLNPSLSGNTAVIGYTYASTTATVTISDNIGTNTWTPDVSCNDGKHTYAIVHALSTAAGTLRLHFHLSAAVGDFQAHATQLYNVTGVDGSSCKAGQPGPSISAGSITATQANDIVFAYAADGAGFCCTNQVASFVPGTSFSLLPNDKRQGTVAELGLPGSTGALNPSMTINQSSHDTFGMAAVAFKSGASGTAPSGIWVYCSGEDHPNTSAYVMQAPCPAPVPINLIVATTNSAPVYNVFTAPSDTDSNTYTGIAASGLYPYIFYAQSAAFTNSNTRTMTWNNASSSTEAVEYNAVGGADASAFDGSAQNTGTQSSPGGASCTNSAAVNSTATITPNTNRSGIAFAVEGNGTGPECDTSGTNNVYDEMWYSGQTDNDTPNYTSSGYGHLTYTTNSPQTLTWNWANASATTWYNVIAAFKAASGPSPPTGVSATASPK